MRLDCLFISRKGRKGRRSSNANHAIAEVVAGYARQRAQRRTEDENGKLSHTNANPQTLAITGVSADCAIT